MDISVSQLNGRLASKLPPELPLGLVFVLGQVSQVDGQHFVLTEGIHQLSCQAVEGTSLRVGDEVRASGHLMFDAEKLRYYLLARDLDLVASEPLGGSVGNSRELLADGDELLSALAAVQARAAVMPSKAADLPPWVKKLAPEEIQVDATEDDETAMAGGTASPTVDNVALDDGLVSMLSAAMDSEDELELTPELLAPYRVAVVEPMQTTGNVMDDQMDTAVPIEPTSYQPANREDTDWLVILLIISFFVLTIAAIVTIVLLIL
ncbi:hypothetical protein [Candidatus Leptofilum sp.]|uniref:hypothetical protein n=1 Tax=Candidatus Leptofilum sp. TaxID=3241576 RepID=UPI003B5B9C4D